MSQRYIRFLILIAISLSIAIWVILPNNPGIHLLGIEKEIDTRLGLDLVGGVQALLEADLPEGQTPDAEAMRTAVNIVENRVNGLGVNEAVVQQAGEDRIVVELPGETDPEKALTTIRQTGLLEFVDFSQLTPQEIATLEAQNATIQTDFGRSGEDQPAAPESGEDTSASPQSDQIFPTVMTGAALKNVNVTQDQAGNYQVAFELNSEDAKTFADFTARNVGNVLAIVLDNKIISAPRIDNAITEGSGVITGNFTLEGANALAIQLRYGSLPIPLKVVETRTVGPTLGEDSLRKSSIAGIIGFSVVILFMTLYYRLPGIIAAVSILIYAVLAFALFRFIPVTLTLPGIAGFMLSTGSALDANILIFERLKEELRAGRTLKQAIDLGWQRAWPSIRDSNIATLITCAILFWFGSTFGATIVKGFSLTLALGVLVSLFTAITVTRTLMNLVLSFFQPSDKARWFGI
jgi:preprotein translocase subunit SecD